MCSRNEFIFPFTLELLCVYMNLSTATQRRLQDWNHSAYAQIANATLNRCLFKTVLNSLKSTKKNIHTRKMLN